MIKISEVHFTAIVKWANVNGGTLVVSFVKNNGTEHKLKKAPVKIQNAEKEGRLLLNRLKALYI